MSRAKGRRVMSGTEDFKDRDFYAINDGLVGRPANTTYLDMVERREAEITRARLEGREPELEDEGSLPAAVGTQLVTEELRVDNKWRSNPVMVLDAVENKDVDPVATLPVSVGKPAADLDLGMAAQVARERQASDEALVSSTESEDSTGRRNEDEVTDEELEALQGANTNTRDQKV